MTPSEAEAYALKVLTWMASEPDILGQFLGATGLALTDLTDAAAGSGFFLGVIDFVMQRDDWVVAAAAEIGLRPEDFQSVRIALPGGAEAHWT
ncbi:MAG: DUF3572 domain-containing protein [Pseudomonadota bacterium]